MSLWNLRKAAIRAQNKREFQRPQYPINYPSGTVVEIETGDIFLIKGKSRLKFATPRIFDTWRLDKIQGSKASVSKFVLGGKVGFRDGTIIQDISNSKYYFISDNKKRHITEPDFFDKWNYNKDSVIMVSAEEANLQKDGDPIGTVS